MAYGMSLNKSLRTTKTTPGLQNTAFTDRIFYETSPSCGGQAGIFLVDSYGRPTSINAGLAFEGPQLGTACWTPLYRISVENELRPQYSDYLNAGGIQGWESNYTNRPHYDTLGVQRDRFFGTDGTYKGITYQEVSKDTNPRSDTDWAKQMAYYGRFNQLNDSRMWLNSPDLQSGF